MVNAKFPALVLTGNHHLSTMQNTLAQELHAAAQAQPGAQQHYSAAAMATAAAAAAPPYMNGRVKSENGSERSGSPHGSDAPRYPGPPPNSTPYSTMPSYPHDMRYGSPSAGTMGVGNALLNGYQSNPQDHHGYGQRPLPDGTGHQPGGQQPVQQPQNGPNVRMAPDNNGPPKAFACSTCGKGFARRSDLARHGMSCFRSYIMSDTDFPSERIHSGHRPHVCDWPGCGKQFIQRSALTVHTRVHTGEKPHMCERCGKVTYPFRSKWTF
jgi:hypothetical protein